MTRHTTQEPSRVTSYRQRAAELAQTIETLPPDQKEDAMRHYKALLHLAAIDDWAASTPRERLFNEYKLNPRPLPPSSREAVRERVKTPVRDRSQG
jgi:hypothetical protein